MGVMITIDNGGTFTDVCLMDKEQVVITKTLTTPFDLTKCFIDVLRAVSTKRYGQENLQKLLSEADSIRYSTTAGTNAIVQKKGPRLGLILAKGKNPSILQETDDERSMFSAMVHDRVATVDPEESVEELEASVVRVVNQLLASGTNRLVVSLSGQDLIEKENVIRKIMLQKYPRHLLGAVPVLFSHELTEDHDDKKRTWSALINSFLHPGMERFLYNAENVLRSSRVKNPLLIFHNDGNSARVAKTTAIKTYGSGPRGGMEGTKALAQHYKLPALLTLDVGGTTSDIGLIRNEKISENLYGEIEGIPTSFRLSDVISVGAGGSSILKVNAEQIQVGPESVGAAPGPACFGRGGQEPTITDANLLMGILDASSYFGGNMVLDESRARAAIEEKIAKPLGVKMEAALLAMEKAYENKIAEGLAHYYERSEPVTLLAFGGAGPMNACGAAEAAGIDSIIVPRMAAVFSAFGISFSDIAHEYQASLHDWTEGTLQAKISELQMRAERDMYAEGYALSECHTDIQVLLVKGSEARAIGVDEVPGYVEELNDADDVQLHLRIVKPISHFAFQSKHQTKQQPPTPERYQRMLQKDGKWAQIPVYDFGKMTNGVFGEGPALIEDPLFTCRILKGWTFQVNENLDIFIKDERRKAE